MPKINNANPGMKLNKVTPRAIKALSKMGLLTRDNLEYQEIYTNIVTDEAKLYDLCAVISVEEFDKTAMDDVDLARVNKGLRLFLARAFSG